MKGMPMRKERHGDILNRDGVKVAFVVGSQQAAGISFFRIIRRSI